MEPSLGVEDVGVDELVAEFALRVVLLEQGLVGGHLWVEVVDGGGWCGEELCPVGAGVEGG